MGRAAQPGVTVGTALGWVLTWLSIPHTGPAPALPSGQPSLRQFVAPLPRLLLGGGHLPVTCRSDSDAGALPPVRVLPHGKCRECQVPSAPTTKGSRGGKISQLYVWLCYQPVSTLRLALSLGASGYPSGLKDPPNSHFPGCLHLQAFSSLVSLLLYPHSRACKLWPP